MPIFLLTDHIANSLLQDIKGKIMDLRLDRAIIDLKLARFYQFIKMAECIIFSPQGSSFLTLLHFILSQYNFHYHIYVILSPKEQNVIIMLIYMN